MPRDFQVQFQLGPHCVADLNSEFSASDKLRSQVSGLLYWFYVVLCLYLKSFNIVLHSSLVSPQKAIHLRREVSGPLRRKAGHESILLQNGSGHPESS